MTRLHVPVLSLVFAAVLAACGPAEVLDLGPEPKTDAAGASTAPVTAPAAAVRELASNEQAVISLFETASPSVVQVVTRARTSFGRDLQDIGSGTGWVWDTEGHIVTNNHVVDGAGDTGKVVVRWSDGTIVDAEVIGRAPQYDLAVLKLEGRPAAPPLQLGRSGTLKVGQSAFAIGNPFGLEETLTSGIVSALERRLPTDGGREIVGVIQTDAAINPGNSGGPLLDSSGHVIGITTAIYSPSGASAGVGFAIPSDTVARMVPQLIKTGRVPLPGIGIATADETVSTRLGVRGVLVWQVGSGTPADRAGLIGTDPDRGRIGDVITAVNGKPVERLNDLAQALETVGVGGAAKLTVDRGGRQLDVDVEVTDIGAR